MISSDAIIIRLNTVKGLVWNLPGKKEDRTNSQAFEHGGCLSSQGFGRIIYFKQNLNAELMCDIYKRDIARKQSGLDSTI